MRGDVAQTTVPDTPAPDQEVLIEIDTDHVGAESELLQRVEEDISPSRVVSGLSEIIFSKENLPGIGMGAVLTALSTGMNFITPWLFGETINLLASDDETVDITGVDLSRQALITLLIAAYTLAQVLPNLRDQVMVPVTANTTKRILKTGTEHLLKKSLDYHVNTSFGDQLFLMQKGFAVGSVATPLLTQVAPTLVEIAIACNLLSSRYGFAMGGGLFAMLVSYIAYGAITAKPIIDAREEGLTAGNEAFSNFTSAIARYKTIRDFGQFEYTMNGVEEALNRMTEADIVGMKKPLQIGLGQYAISRAGMLLATLYVGHGVVTKEYSVQDFIVVAGYLNSLANLFPAFGQAVNQLFAAWPDLKFVFKELSKPDELIELHPDTHLVLSEGIAPAIEFENVTFTHAPKPGESDNAPLFENLSFTIQPGQKVALVSESGAGKTTVFNMLYGYYKPAGGVIRINGQNIAEVSLKSLEQNISLLGQTPNLFKGTIRENICFGAANPDEVNDAAIWALARACNLETFLQSFKNGLDTQVGEDGKSLSGGQQQKVAIMRGFIKRSPILLLDEITASLDSQSATQILRGVAQMTDEGVTSLMITHKLTEAKTADAIIVIHEGRVMAQGTHDELLATCPLYQQLWCSYHQQEPLSSCSTGRLLAALGGPVQAADALSGEPGKERLFLIDNEIQYDERELYDEESELSDFEDDSIRLG
ncbi:ABC transporter ATP-binding protein [Legionella sp. CNM-4043-24]|uniref:ABC transporter ATP-binding protein n=1 Tax=Legionella sp. CNM-4043-24 TaxID=3421646 RepID=UPI00403AF7CC